MQEVKDSLSYVSLDLDADLRAARAVKPVSYTHLTLPTILLV